MLPDRSKEPLVVTSARIERPLLEQLEWIARREKGWNRNALLNEAVRAFVAEYARDHGVEVGRVPMKRSEKG